MCISQSFNKPIYPHCRVLIWLRLFRRIFAEGAPQAPLQQRQRLRCVSLWSHGAMELAELTELERQDVEKWKKDVKRTEEDVLD